MHKAHSRKYSSNKGILSVKWISCRGKGNLCITRGELGDILNGEILLEIKGLYLLSSGHNWMNNSQIKSMIFKWKKPNSVLLLNAKGNRRFCIWIQCNIFCTGLIKYKLLIVGSILMNFSSVHWCSLWWTICLWACWCMTAYSVFQENDEYWKDSD